MSDSTDMVGEDLDDILGGLDEALGGPRLVPQLDSEGPAFHKSLKGRTTDVRQNLPGIQYGMNEWSGLDPGGWLVAFPKDQYPASQSFLGPCPIVLMGHRSMSEDEFRGFMRTVHSIRYPSQATEPAVAVEPGHLIDLRRFCYGGDYHSSVRQVSPVTARLAEELAVLVDGLLSQPISHQGLSALKRSGMVYPVSEALMMLLKIAKNVVEPHSSKRTLGDVLNRISWPFSGGTVGTQRTL